MERAARIREVVRQRVSRLLEEFPARIRQLTMLAGKAREQAAVGAPVEAVVQLVGVEAGQQALPGRPIALLSRPGANMAEIILPGAYPAKPGEVLPGRAGEQVFAASVTEVREHRIPFSFRQGRNAGTERCRYGEPAGGTGTGQSSKMSRSRSPPGKRTPWLEETIPERQPCCGSRRERFHRSKGALSAAGIAGK